VSEYTLHILPDDAAKTSATITVRLTSRGPEVQEIDVCIGNDATPFPEELSQLDFQSVIRAVAALSMGHLPGEHDMAMPSVDLVEPGPIEPRQRQAAAATKPPVKLAAQSRQGGQKRRRTDNSDAPSDLATMYWKLGTTAKVAAHYSVPRQIAQSWIQTLRQGGKLPNPWQQKRTRSGPTKDEGR
jgi:hypothetical protein